jgi:hypothetical protein
MRKCCTCTRFCAPVTSEETVGDYAFSRSWTSSHWLRSWVTVIVVILVTFDTVKLEVRDKRHSKIQHLISTCYAEFLSLTKVT